jgi:hypothetical protein
MSFSIDVQIFRSNKYLYKAQEKINQYINSNKFQVRD